MALERFGNATLVKERTQDVDMFRWIRDLGRDIHYALRMMRRSPGFSVLAILCLTLGIGANAAVFSWIEGILLRPYPLVVDQDRLFAVTGTNRGAPGHTDVSWPDWLDLQRNSTLVQAFIGEKITTTSDDGNIPLLVFNPLAFERTDLVVAEIVVTVDEVSQTAEQASQRAKAVAGQWKIGDPSDPTVLMGPLIRESQRGKVERLIGQGREEGARLVFGGGRPAHLPKGFFTEITLFDDVENRMRIAQEEVFGPVGVTIGFDTDDEAIAIANDSRYGLNGGILSADAATAYEMSLKIRAGSVFINGGTGKMSYAPIGGYKRSGIGREYGPDWLREFTQEKSIFYPVGR